MSVVDDYPIGALTLQLVCECGRAWEETVPTPINLRALATRFKAWPCPTCGKGDKIFFVPPVFEEPEEE